MPPTDARADAALDDLFPRPRGWYRAESGNLTVQYIFYRLTVYPGRYGGFLWIIGDGWGLLPSPGAYPTEEVAKAAVMEAARGLDPTRRLPKRKGTGGRHTRRK